MKPERGIGIKGFWLVLVLCLHLHHFGNFLNVIWYISLFTLLQCGIIFM